MDQVRVGRVKGIRIAVAAFAMSVFLFVAVAGGAFYLLTHKSDETAVFASDLRNALVDSCEINGNAQREVTRQILHEEIADAEHPDPALVAVLGIPPDQLDALIAESVAKFRARLRRVKPVDCAAQYPKP
jgi:hypothetical protein